MDKQVQKLQSMIGELSLKLFTLQSNWVSSTLQQTLKLYQKSQSVTGELIKLCFTVASLDAYNKLNIDYETPYLWVLSSKNLFDRCLIKLKSECF